MANTYIAQLLVLYEDLRIELYRITANDIGKLDSTDQKYRRHYSVRRSIGTWSEFAQAIRLLDQLDEFRQIEQEFDAASLKKWDKAVRFFKKYEHFVKAVRNDIGGHFGPKAAKYAIANFRTDVQGKFELTRYDTRGGGMRVYFAGGDRGHSDVQKPAGRGNKRSLRNPIPPTTPHRDHGVEVRNAIHELHRCALSLGALLLRAENAQGRPNRNSSLRIELI
jgi:hypothetical protein